MSLYNSSHTFGVQSLYDKDLAEEMRAPNPYWDHIYQTKEQLKRLAIVPMINQSGTKCECGSAACGSPRHSDWCPLHTAESGGESRK